MINNNNNNNNNVGIYVHEEEFYDKQPNYTFIFES